MERDQARLNITFDGQNGDLPAPVLYESSLAEIQAWATEAVLNGGVPGIEVRDGQGVDFQNYVVDRFPAAPDRPDNLLMLRPKTPYGMRP